MWGNTFGVALEGEIDAVPIEAGLGIKIIPLPIQATTSDASAITKKVKEVSEPSEDP